MFQIALKNLREKAGLSQYALAEKLGIAQSTVGMWESGKREPDFKTLKKIAMFFCVTTDYLIGNISNNDIKEPVVANEMQKALLKKSDELNTENQEELNKYADLLKIKQSIDNNKKAETSGSLNENA